MIVGEVLKYNDAEEIVQRINDAFLESIFDDETATRLLLEAQKSIDYKTANEYAVRVGELLSNALKRETAGYGTISPDTARALLTQPLNDMYQTVCGVTQMVQNNMNKAAGIGLAAVVPSFDTNRVDGLAKALSRCAGEEQIQQMLGEPIVNYSQSIVDRSVRDNAAANTKAGIKAYIERRTGTEEVREAPLIVRRGNKVYKYMRKYKVPCKWCNDLEGVYNYDDVKRTGSDVFRRHESCRCTVTYRQGVRVVDVWSKDEWTQANVIQQRQEVERAERFVLSGNKPKEYAQQAEIKLREIGFTKVDNKLFKNVDRELLEANIDRLAKLEERFNVFHRSDRPWIEYNGRVGYVACISAYGFNPSMQGLTLTKFYKNAQELYNKEMEWLGDNWLMPFDAMDRYTVLTSTVAHEYGHALQNLLYHQEQLKGVRLSDAVFTRGLNNEVFAIAREIDPNVNVYEWLSDYGKTNSFETWAEMFANSQNGAPNILGDAMNIWLKRKGF